MLVRLVISRRLPWLVFSDLLVLLGLSAVLYCAVYSVRGSAAREEVRDFFPRLFGVVDSHVR